MKRLKCSDCGGQVRVKSSEDGLLLGSCAHCAAEYVLEVRGRQHIIVEHRFPDHAPLPRGAKVPLAAGGLARRAVLGLGGVAVLGAAATVLGLGRTTGPAPGGRRAATTAVLFNTGGKGPGAGQFRDHIFGIGIDSLGRAALVDNRERVYVFGPEGQFLTHYAQDEARKGKFAALLPGGDLVMAGHRAFHRLSLESGALIETVETSSDPSGWNAAYALTANGGIGAYSTAEHGHSQPRDTPVADQIIFFGPDLREQRRVTGLLAQAIAPDPMVSQWPRVTSIAVDPAGSLYLNIRAAEDHDLRGGIFEFNADGRLLRRIEVEQSWQGQLAVGADRVLWYGDAWRNDLQRISPNGRQVLALSGLAATQEEALGNVACFALYPNGDIGLATMNHRFVRLRPAPEAQSAA